jgi:hypothetical protein
VGGKVVSKGLLFLTVAIISISILIASLAGNLVNQTASMVSIPQKQFLAVSENNSNSYSIEDIWNLHSYYCNATLVQNGRSLEVKGYLDSNYSLNNTPSVFIETTSLNINNSFQHFSIQVKQAISSALIVRLGVDSQDWLKAVNNNVTLANLRYGGATNNVTWVTWNDYPSGKTGSLEVIWGSGQWQNVSVNWNAYLTEALNYNFTSLKGVQLILGFRDNINQFSSLISNAMFSVQPILTISEGNYQSVLVFRSQAIISNLERGFFPERAHITFQMNQSVDDRFMALMVWKNDNESLTIVRNGFELESVIGSQSLWIDFWNVIPDVKTSVEPFSTLSDVMIKNDFALVFVSTSATNNVTLSSYVKQIDVFLSKPGLKAAVNDEFDLKTVSNETTFYLLIVGIIPLFLLSLFYVFRKNALTKPRFWFGLVIVSGLIIRFILAPISSHQADVLQFSDVGALFYGEKNFFNFWVDFPLYYYPLVAASLPYSIFRAFGFVDSSYLAITSFVWQMVAIKIVPILADVIAYVYLCKLFGSSRERLFNMGPEIYFLGSFVILTSATWAHLNSLFIALLIVGVYYTRKGRWLRSTFFFSLASMTIPVGFVGVLAVILGSLLLRKYKLTVKMILISITTFFVTILPMTLSSGSTLASLIQRLVVGQVANAPVYGPTQTVIGGVIVNPFFTSGYKFTRLLEYQGIAFSSVFLNLFLIISILGSFIWFIFRFNLIKSEKTTFYDGFFELLVRLLAIVFGLFLLFFSTANFIWNFWPAFALVILLSFKKQSYIAIIAIIYSYILLIGFEFVEHLSFLATGYNIQYFDQLRIKLDYWMMNLGFSLLFSLLACIVIIISLWGQRINISSFLKNIYSSIKAG